MAMKMQLVIRDARPSDAAALNEIWSPWYVASALGRIGDGSLIYLVAERDDHVVAQLCVDVVAMPNAGYIFAVSVLPAAQGEGIGTALLAEAERRVRALSLPTLTLKVEHANPRAQALYERLGFTVVGDGFDEWDERLPDGSVVRHVKVATWLMRKGLH